MKHLSPVLFAIAILGCGKDSGSAATEGEPARASAAETAPADQVATDDESDDGRPAPGEDPGDDDAVPASWVRFEVPDSPFTVSVPTEPGPPEHMKVPTVVGEGSGDIYMIQSDGYFYGVSLLTMPTAFSDGTAEMGPDVIESAFDGGVEQMIANMDATKTDESDLEVAGLPAREARFEVEIQGRKATGRALMIADADEKKVLQLMALSDRPLAATEPFFGSFAHDGGAD